MSKGDEYAKAMPEILVYMYGEGAVGPEQTAHLDAIAQEVGLQPKEAKSVMRLLEEQGKVTQVTGKFYRLTGPGFEEAQRLSKSKKSWVRGSVK